ncbi:unnamed protein product [Heligmosomoides polygyrus]|uniref:Uncharacterized protein n=1 Tax=Heligmosomoides polygyrus TaxID=6339 RepID=A0A183G3I9_HELPZ|nr:unnamed protein product [Heligmosomoides polygyrus]
MIGVGKRVEIVQMQHSRSANFTTTHVQLSHQVTREDAREAIMRFLVTEASYEEAVQWLQRRYGSSEAIIDRLYRRLEELKADGRHSSSAKTSGPNRDDMAQLANREEDVNKRQLFTQIFRKFSQPVQAKILEKMSELENLKLWDWKRFYAIVDDIISNKKLIKEAQTTGPNSVEHRSNAKANEHSNGNRRPYQAPECLYCKRSTHRSIECTSLTMPQRAAF